MDCSENWRNLRHDFVLLFDKFSCSYADHFAPTLHSQTMFKISILMFLILLPSVVSSVFSYVLFLSRNFRFHQDFHFLTFGSIIWLLVCFHIILLFGFRFQQQFSWKYELLMGDKKVTKWQIKLLKQNIIQIFLSLPFKIYFFSENFHLRVSFCHFVTFLSPQ